MSQGPSLRPSARQTSAGTHVTSVQQAQLPTPEAMAAHLFGPVWNVAVVIGWITLPVAFFSAIQDLKLTIDTAVWIYRHADVVLKDVLDEITQLAKAAVTVWRELIAPLRWLALQLPFRVPKEVIDLFAINAFCAPSLARAMWAGSERLRRGLAYKKAHGLIRFRTSRKLQAAGYEFTAADRRYNQAMALAAASILLWLVAIFLFSVNWWAYR